MNVPVIEPEQKLSTLQKALTVNLDPRLYGTMAEIGAGQEVARNFFQAGGAAGTIAKSMSAYDMTFSDSIYGREESGRYVSKNRLSQMLDYEYALLIERLKEKRSRNTQFFVMADTVAAKAYKSNRDAHGWMGVRGQLYPGAEPSEVVLHVRMRDGENRQQQEALGILGVNMIYGMFFHYQHPEIFIRSLTDNLAWGRVEIDMILFSGPYFDELDNRLMDLELVKSGLSDAVMYSPEGEIVEAAEELYKKNILAIRGSFRPVTNIHIDMLRCAQETFCADPMVDKDRTVVLAEITMAQLSQVDGEIDPKDFLARVDNLTSLGYHVLISNYLRYFRVQSYFRRYTNRKVGIVVGMKNIRDIFDVKFYEGFEGGILGALGLLFSGNISLYVYPALDKQGELLTVKNPEIAPELNHLYHYLWENDYIMGLSGHNPEVLKINHQDVFQMIRQGIPGWESCLPPGIAEQIKQRRLFEYDTI